jgi:hypothetical protein
LNESDYVLLMLNLPFLRQAYKVCQEPVFCVRQYSCLLINAVCSFSLRSARRTTVLVKARVTHLFKFLASTLVIMVFFR